MKILFVNGHPQTSVGKSKFNTYLLQVKAILTNTLFFGQHHEQIIRNYHQLEEYLYDQESRYIDPKSLQRFQLLDYIFIDGDIHVEPYDEARQQLVILIKMCVKYNIKFHLNRFGFTTFYYLQIQKQKQVIRPQFFEEIRQNQVTFKDSFYNRQLKSTTNIYNSKRVQSKLYWKNSQFHYVCNSKVMGNSLLKNVNFPVMLYCRSKWLCYPIDHLKSNFTCLVETENKSPVVIQIGNGIATLSMCEQFLTILKNWIIKVNKGMITTQQSISTLHKNMAPSTFFKEENYVFTQQIQQDNVLSLQSTLKRPFSGIRPNTSTTWLSRFSRPQTGMKRETFSKMDPIIRNSGPYATQESMRKDLQKSQQKKIIGRRYLSHSRTLDQYDIKNYVQQTPSQPAITHNFRVLDKSKWVSKKPFYVA